MNSLAGKIHRPQAVLEATVYRTGIDQAGEAQLPDVAQPLKPGMLHQIIDQITWQVYKPVYRVIDNLSPVSQTECFYAHKFIQLFPKQGKKSFIYSTPLNFYSQGLIAY
jgi:hypothetical protein